MLTARPRTANFRPSKLCIKYLRQESDGKKARQHLTNEVWCRKAGSLTRTGFDVVIQSELVAGEIRWRARLTRSYASRESQGTDFVVETREVLNLQLDHPSENLLRYRAEEFRLLIDTEESIAETGKYESKLDLGDVDVEFHCRIDGLNVSNR